jgi:TolB-like protein/DNA-binding winged helix-turn-helix (wHTH) protein
VSTPEAAPPTDVVRFGAFEVDLRSGELRRKGVKVRLQDQPFRLLRILLDHAGEVVTREELQRQIWPSDTFVDFDRGLNNAIKRLREALGDTADTPRYVETLPKRGYRFVAPLVERAAPEPAVVADPPAGARVQPAGGTAVPPAGVASLPKVHGATRVVLGALGVMAALAALGLASNVGGLRDRLFGTSAAPVTEPQIHSLAVIPLTNLSADPAQAYFSDGITDALITELAQLRPIRVISRTSVMHYKKTEKTLPEIARELNVDGIVEGTVQRSGERVRITAQLIYAPADKHLWASTYERDLRDVFLLERELTQEIARQVQAQLTSPGQPPPPHPRPVNVQALDAYLQGAQHLNRVGRGGSDEERQKAAPYFQRAIEFDPTFVPAYLGLADAHCYYLLPSSPEDVAIIRQARQRVAELDQSALDRRKGPCAHEQHDPSQSEEQQYRACLARDPNNVGAHRDFARFLDNRGRLDEGWREQQIAQQLDPHPDRTAPDLDLQEALMKRGQYDQAIELISRVVESEPHEWQSHHDLALCYEAKGMQREEIEELGRTATSYGFPEIEPRLRRAFAASGYRGALRRWARECEQLEEAGKLYAPTYLARIYLRLDEKTHAYRLLEEAYRSRNRRRSECSSDYDPVGELEHMRKDSQFRSDPAFLDLLRRLGLT